jgi:glycine betaine/proline transport system ATP-binding protein
MNGIAIIIKNLTKIFGPDPQRALIQLQNGYTKQQLMETGHLVALHDVNMEIPTGGIHVIMGLSGSGKSTLLRHLNALIAPDSGKIYVSGHDLSLMSANQIRQLRQQQISMVFQNFALFPHLTVWQNIEFGAADKDSKNINCWIQRVGLGDYEDYYPNQLSGGMQQRVGLARALATGADIILMDEAFSALDPLIRFDMQRMLLDLQKEFNKTIVFITHDLDEALKIGNTITILNEGTIVQQGTPQQIVMSPIDSYVAEFVKGSNRAQIVRCWDLEKSMKPASGPTVAVNTSLIDAIKILGQTKYRSVNLVDKTGEYCGTVDLDQMVKFL